MKENKYPTKYEITPPNIPIDKFSIPDLKKCVFVIFVFNVPTPNKPIIFNRQQIIKQIFF
jgi:hypothetical protein